MIDKEENIKNEIKHIQHLLSEVYNYVDFVNIKKYSCQYDYLRGEDEECELLLQSLVPLYKLRRIYSKLSKLNKV